MIYYQDDDLIIRNMEEADAQVFYDEYTAQGWHPDIATYHMRLKDQAEGRCVALTAVYRGWPAGSVYVFLKPHAGPFMDKGWPEIHDFSVLKKYQRRGIGNRLMDTAERIAGQYADTVWLGVGVCDSYGSAQRMYIKRGYIPDGSGVWYRDQQCRQYETVCTVDDDLILYLSKKLPGTWISREMNRSDNPRQAAAEEAETVAAMACELWPEHSPEERAKEYEQLLSAGDGRPVRPRQKEESMDKWLETKQIPSHCVSAAGVVYKDDKVLLIRSERRGWEIPGGIVEQGEAILDGLRREILEESGITAEPECITGIYQNLENKKGYGPLEGMTLPTTVNMVFRCRYTGGEAAVSDACVETGWFTPDEAMERITYDYMRKAFEDAHFFSGSQHFGTFRKKDREIIFTGDRLL